VLRGPTQDVWIRPWIKYLKSHSRAKNKTSVKFHSDLSLKKITVRYGQVTALEFARESLDPRFVKAFEKDPPANLDAAKAAMEGLQRTTVTSSRFDYVILALPVEQMAKLVSKPMIALDPDLEHLDFLADNLEWMSGIQFYLKALPPGVLGRGGHVNFIDSPWALTAIVQSQTWDRPFRKALGARTGAVLSVCVSDWKRAGFNGKIAMNCTRDEIASEVWHQILRAMPEVGAASPSKSSPPPSSLDEDLWQDHKRQGKGGPLQNAEPLLVNTVGSWKYRPKASTRIQNLLLAGDYIQTNTGLACMESANESARRAVNEVLLRTGDRESAPCEIWALPEPAFAKAAQVRDQARFDRGLPWRDVPGSPMSLLVQGGGTIAKLIQFLINRPTPHEPAKSTPSASA
jgi:hypothetical protein